MGRSKETNRYIFYHPPSKQQFTSVDFSFDKTLAAAPTFNLQYDGGLFSNKFDEGSTFHWPPVFVPEQQVFVITTTPHIKATIMIIPGNNDNIYTVMYDNNRGLHQHLEDDIFNIDSSPS